MINQQKNYTRWFNVDWKIILKSKLSDAQRARIMYIISTYLKPNGITIEYAGIDPNEFTMGSEEEVMFPNNYKITTSDASANFSLDFKLPNLEPIIKHRSGELSLVMMLEEILDSNRESAEIPLINMS